MKIALYTRVSTDTQFEKGNSIPEQQKRLKAFCESKGWTNYEIFTDGGYSGSNLDRPALQELIKRIDEFGMVLVYKLDRLSRNQRDTLYLIEDVFLGNSVEFNSITENFDTSTPVGRLMLSMMSAFAELERQQINERMHMGRKASASKGQWFGAQFTPFGYTYSSKKFGGSGKLEINPEEVAGVRKMFDLMEQNASYNSINKYLTAHYSVGKGQPNAIKKMLSNPVYIGKVKYSGEVYDGIHDAIIDEEQFNRVQTLIAQREGHQLRPTYDRKHLLTGLLRCSCGARACYVCSKQTNSQGKKVVYEYYECYSRRQNHMATQKGCKNKSWRKQELEDTIWEVLEDLTFEEFSSGKSNNNSVHNIESLEKQKKALENQRKKLMDLYAIDGIPLNDLETKINDLNRRIKALDEQISLESIQPSQIGENELKDMISNIDIIRQAPLSEQRAFVHSLISEIMLLPNHDLQIKWNF